MERTGDAAPTASASLLSDVARATGPFLSVYMTTEAAVENPALHAERRWKSLRRELLEGGAPEARLAVVDERVADAHLEGQALGVVTAASGASVLDHDGEPLLADLCTWGDAPVLTPLVAWRQHEPPYVAVLADHRGADLIAVSRDRPPAVVSAGDEQWPISKARGGGRAHWRFEHRVEETWARNERQVAAELERLVDLFDARLVVLAGDERAIGLLRTMVPDRIADVMHTVPGGRATESTNDDFGDGAARWVHSVAANETVQALEALHGREADGRAVQGAAATLHAVAEARVDVLVVHDERLTPASTGAVAEASDGAVAWFDQANPATCALTRGELHGIASGDLGAASIVDVAVRGALATGASVRLVPSHGGPRDGVGALLRWRE